MSIVVADNFQYKGGKPLDARLKFSSVSDMAGTPAAELYDGCFAYVTGTKKYYSYDSSNAIDPTLSKWREFSAGAEYSDFTGATSQEAGAHGLVPAPTTGDISKFLKGDGTWATVPMPSFDYSNTSPEAMNFSTDEKVIGTWIDGKPLYQKTVDCGSLPANSTKDVPHNISNIDKIVCSYGTCVNSNDKTLPLPYVNNGNLSYGVQLEVNKTNVHFETKISGLSDYYAYITLRYTKTTDTAVASGEKIVGQWIDGKPVYEKAISATMPNGNGTLASTEIPIEKLIDIAFIVGSNDKNVVRGDNTNNGFSMWINSDNECKVENLMAWLKGQSGILFLRYTKTTD